jgi:superfamily II DNA or RNA helicase
MEEDIQNIQDEVVSHILNSFERDINPICALGMGLGKTRVACKIINNIMQINNYMILIIIKASNFENPWIDELIETKCITVQPNNIGINNRRQFTNCIYMHDKERHKYSKDTSSVFHLPLNNIYLSSYDTFRIDLDEGRYDNSLQFDLVIFDELQLIMNIKKRKKKLLALSKINGNKKIALSGTPIQNDPDELGLMYIFLNNKAQLLYYFRWGTIRIKKIKRK